MYFKILTKIDVKCLNNYLNQWEYFIEPFRLEFYYCKFLKRMMSNIELFVNDMININVSLNYAKILQFILEKFKLMKEEQKMEKEETSCIERKITDNFDTPRYIGYEAPILILENYSGVDMDIWFDKIKYDDKNNKDLIIRIKSNEKYELTKNSLIKYQVEKKNNNLNCTMSYKFILEQNLIKDMNINEKNLIGNNFNINYYHIEIHNITKHVKVSVESSSDNLLIRHIIFSSLISLKNVSKYQNFEISNNIEKIELNNNKKHIIPISWLLEKRNPSLNLIHGSWSNVLIKNMSDISNINKSVKLNNGIVTIDVIKYKLNLNEYYLNKNISFKKEDIYRIDIMIISPINLINNTPYDFLINTKEKILPMKSISSCPNNSDLLLDYQKIMNDQDRNSKDNKKEIITKILKDIQLQTKYNGQYLTVHSFISQKEEDDVKIPFNFSILLKNKNSKEYLICRLILNDPYKTLLFDNKIYKEMEIELNSFRYEIIFDYYFVNKTLNNLFFNNKPINSLKIPNENLLISAKQFLPVSKILLNDKIQLRKTEKDWTKRFNLSALGKEFILNIKTDNKTYNALSLMTKISTKFEKSLILIIEEKFIIINELPFDIGIKEDKLGTIIKYKSKESNALLLDKETFDQNAFVSIGINNCFSHKFVLSKLGSYDILVPYDQKTFEKLNIDIDNKLVEFNLKKYYPIRCVINTLHNNTIYIIFTLNHQYINQLNNYTSKTIEVFIQDEKTKKFKVEPDKTIPLVFINKEDKYESFEKIKIIFDKNVSTEVFINEIANKFCGKNKDYYIRIRPEKNNSVKSITLFGEKEKDKRLLGNYSYKKKIKKYTISQGAKILLNFEGIGFSLIDEIPKEIFYLSIYKLFLNYSFSSHNNILNEIHIYNSLTFSIKNMQLDYCLDNAYEIVFNPTNQILPPKFGENIENEKNHIKNEKEKENEDTPFIQFVLSKKAMQEKNDNKIEILYTIFPEIAIMIQEFDARINTILINCLINLVNQYLKIFLPGDENDNNEMEMDKITKENNSLIDADNININEIKK